MNSQPLSLNLKLPSANSVCVDESKICRLGKGKGKIDFMDSWLYDDLPGT